jgi:site-specific recombinase XerD
MLHDILYDDIKAETDRAYGSETTRASYKSDFGKFKEWATEQGLPYLPTSPEVISHWLIEEAGAGMRPERLARCVNAIKFFHEWADKPCPTDDVLVRAALRWARRHWEEEQNKETETATELPSAANGAGAQH